MPFYVYYCKKCDSDWEELRHIDDDAPPKCEVCGRKSKKVPALSSFTLKGKGWFKDGY